MPKAKRSKVWLHFTQKDANSATCNRCQKTHACKGGNTSNLMKHLATHGVYLKAEQCTVFDKLRDAPSTSAAAAAGQIEESPSPSPVSVVDITDDDDDSSRSSSVTPFTLAKKAALPKEKVEEIHRKVTQFVVMGLHSFSTVESPSFREMTTALNPKYQPPSRDDISNTLIPAWYNVIKQNVIQQLAQVSKIAITCDGWTSVAQDHYLTVTVHYMHKGSIQQKVLSTEVVYEAQTGLVFLKVGCFAHTLNLAAQKVYGIQTVTRWCAKIRAVVVWLKRSTMSKTVLREKQRLLNLPEHNVILDVRTRWNSLNLMVERFVEQFPAIQAACLDQRLRRPMERDRLERLTESDFEKAEEFMQCMKVLYTSTLCVSSDKTPTCSQILPILTKLEAHYSAADEDNPFVAAIKEKVWGDLEKRYQDQDIQNFLQEATLMDPRFKGRLGVGVAEAWWDRLEKAVIDRLPTEEDPDGDDEVEEDQADRHPRGAHRMSALEQLFADEDRELLHTTMSTSSALSITEQVQKEIELYKGMPAIPSGQDPVAWWWGKRDTFPNLSALSEVYLCVQASSTPSERVFSCAGHAISQERCRILPEKANMLIFLQKNC
ncbi:Zinc finger BED domain-containing protein 1 [Merluccius polli]|uniref:Zinc finger BED domain-containing protein 1 n=1 Tax=Merluccius polli TaxID=89951 RepID=A0AA47NAL4_MERPO|nr:Zinc finger BED domain-containing protein 1 [Merluccius polli]